MQNVIKGFRLSPQQKRLWRLQQTGSAYCAQCALLLEGSLQSDVLLETIQLAVDRHEILRTTFHRPPGMKSPLQVVTDRGAPSWRHVDLSDRSAQEQDSDINEILRQERSCPFDFERGLPLRLSLLSLSAHKHILVITLPSLCADAWTLKNLVREIGRVYLACLRKERVYDDVVQYVKYAEWQNELLEGEIGKSGHEYWGKQKLDVILGLTLPFERRSIAQTGFEPDSLVLRIDPEVSARLESIARRYDSSIQACLLACWQTSLWRLTGQSDLVIGYSVDGRKHRELQEALGLFAKMVPVQSHFEEGLAFNQLLERLDQSTRDASGWQEYFTWEQIPVSAGDSTIPSFFPASFSFEEQSDRFFADGVCFSIYKQYSCIDRFKVKLSCVRLDDALSVEFHYDPAVFTIADVQRLACRFEELLKSIVRNPEASIGELEIVGEADRLRLLVAFNSTIADYPQDRSIHQLFEEQVERTPDRIAVVFEERQMTYAELNARANQLAHLLRWWGVGPDVTVGLFLERSVETLVGLLSVLKAGGAYVPLDAEYPTARLRSLIAMTKAPVLLTQEKLLPQAPAFQGQRLCLDKEHSLFENLPRTNPRHLTVPLNLSYVIYTSGSTGSPKGVAIGHRSLVNYAHFICNLLQLNDLSLEEQLRFATVSTLSADLGNTSIFPSLISGGCLHIISYEVAADDSQFADYVIEHPIDVLKIVPSHLDALLSGSGVDVLPHKYLILGGEALSFELVDRIRKLPIHCQVINHYGPTETTIGSLTFNLEEKEDSAGMAATTPIGRPIANTQIYILDRRFNPAPIGARGELYIGGDGLARCYLDQSELTAEKFIPDPYGRTPGRRLYCTGDLARYLPAGQVEFLGRLDHQVKLRGRRIELNEIEAKLREHPLVREAVVVARAEEAGRQRLVAYWVATQRPAPTLSQLHTFLRQQLPDYMVPATFVQLAALPLTPNGKVDRRALPELGSERPLLERAYAAPRTPVEIALAQIWSQILGVEPIGRDDNFFELGGDSILSLKVVARAQVAGLHLTPKQLFERRTIAELAQVVSQSRSGSLAQGPVTGALPLTPIQCWYFEQAARGAAPSALALLLTVSRKVEPVRMTKVIHELMTHHDALRLRFVEAGGGWRQFHADPGEAVEITPVDLTALPEDEQGAAIAAVSARLQESLNLSDGPLVGGALFELGQKQGQRLLLVIHHLVVDGVSWRILLEDLEQGYEQLSRGQKIELEPKTTSFKEWAGRMWEHTRQGGFASELGYWLSKTRGLARGLPVDFEMGANTVASARRVTVALTEEQTQALLLAAPRAYNMEVNDVLLTALGQVLSQWTGTSVVSVEVEGHGREARWEDVNLSRTVGWFTTRYPIVIEVKEELSASGAALKLVKEQLRGAPNRGLGYGWLRYASENAEVIKLLSDQPQPQISFNYLGQFDRVNGEDSLFGLVGELSGVARQATGERRHLVEVEATVFRGQLRLQWTYSENTHLEETIAGIAEEYLESLRRLIAHCLSPESGGYTPSDFPLADLGQDALDKFFTMISQAGGRDSE